MKGFGIGGAIFIQRSIAAITIPLFAIYENIKVGTTYLYQRGLRNDKIEIDDEDQMMKEKNLFDDDVEQISKGLDNLGTPLNAIDT